MATALSLAAFGFSPGAVNAAELEPEVGGLVLDRSLTPMGKDFYREFALRWAELSGGDSNTLSLVESALPQNGTLLVIELNGQKVFRTFLSRRNGALRPLVEQAAQTVLRQLAAQNNEEYRADMAASGY